MTTRNSLKTGCVFFGSQLFAPALIVAQGIDVSVPIFMAEDLELCTYYKFHKHKIILFLASMRAYATELRDAGYDVTYISLDGPRSEGNYEVQLANFVRMKSLSQIMVFEIEDKFMEKRFSDFCHGQNLDLCSFPSPSFLTTRELFANYQSRTKKLFMKTFYEEQRVRLGILMDFGKNPRGGQFSFDADNRKKLPQHAEVPQVPLPVSTPLVREVCALVNVLFPDHPGSSVDFWLPTTRAEAQIWLADFVEHRLAAFGPYEDALSERSPFLFHSVLSPLLNIGLITPQEVLATVLPAAELQEIPLPSVEGFVRQLIGWREFVRGVYRHESETQENTNFFQHSLQLATCWYDGTTGILPLDLALSKVQKWGYAHHIERLMIISNIMLLVGISPRESHKWFMEMFVDSADWVMGPNVFGMGQFSDGGIFATKPYICGSNYLLKMGEFEKGTWCEDLDALYWSFIERHFKFFSSNFRTKMIAHAFVKLSSSRKEVIMLRAEQVRRRLTLPFAKAI